MSKRIIISIAVPETDESKISSIWRELRVAEGLPSDNDLGAPLKLQNFDAASMAQWSLNALPVVAPILTAIFGYLIAARGELTVERNGEKITMKNLRPSQLKQLLKILDEVQEDSD